MNANANIEVDKATFYRFLERQAEGRFEYDRGRIVQLMTGGTRRHTRIAQRFITTIERLLDAKTWLVSGHSRGVDTPATVRYPDAVVEPLDGDDSSLATDQPALLVEVLSRSTEDIDLNAKPAEYMSLPSLLAYVVASQDQPQLTVWLRRADGTFPDTPEVITGRERELRVDALGLVIPLSEIYLGIGA